MNFLVGSTCWHVIGYVNGDPWRPKTLCGWRGNDYVIGGTSTDAAISLMPLCKTCDKATGGQASEYVEAATAASEPARS